MTKIIRVRYIGGPRSHRLERALLKKLNSENSSIRVSIWRKLKSWKEKIMSKKSSTPPSEHARSYPDTTQPKMHHADAEHHERIPPANNKNCLQPGKIVSLTHIDGTKVHVLATFLGAVLEPDGVNKAAGTGALIYYVSPVGVNGLPVKEAHEDVLAAWRIALGVKAGNN